MNLNVMHSVNAAYNAIQVKRPKTRLTTGQSRFKYTRRASVFFCNSINQSINQPFDRLIDRSINQSINQSISARLLNLEKQVLFCPNFKTDAKGSCSPQSELAMKNLSRSVLSNPRPAGRMRPAD